MGHIHPTYGKWKIGFMISVFMYFERYVLKVNAFAFICENTESLKSTISECECEIILMCLFYLIQPLQNDQIQNLIFIVILCDWLIFLLLLQLSFAA